MSGPAGSDPAAALAQALALHQQGRLAEAEALYRGLVAARPDHLEAVFLLGTIACQSGDFPAAESWLGRALALQPDHVAALSNRGYARRNLGRLEDALADCGRALALRPDFADALSNRAAILLDLGRAAAALAACEQGLALKPDLAVLQFNRGNALLALARPAEAIASFDQALLLAPGFGAALLNQGQAWQALGHHPEALACYDRLLALEPGNAGGHRNRAVTLAELGRHGEAAEAFARVLALAPDTPYAAGDLLHSRLHCCDWQDDERERAAIIAGIMAGAPVASPFVLLSLADAPAAQHRAARDYVAAKHPAQPALAHCAPQDKIRLGYLSGDLRNHAVAALIAGVIEAHDKSRVETVALSFGGGETDAMRRRLERAFTRFLDIRNAGDRDVAELMAGLGIDIAIDLMGHTGASRPGILAWRPAPIQVNFLGYPGTMGAPYIDYVLADRVVLPDIEHAYYSEKVVYLPDCYQPNDRARAIAAATPSRAAAGLPDSGFVFCCFNNLYKVAPPVFAIWMRLLRAVEGSVLWLLGDALIARRNLRRQAEAQGVAPTRLIFAPRLAPDQHLARHRLADLMLDTWPYNAHTTASDALWAGLPLVTCRGRSFAARVGASLLGAAFLPELITETPDEYEALALALAHDPVRLAQLKAKLAETRLTCPLFDTDRFRRHLESAFETMVAHRRQGRPPESFAVDPIG
jgi:protein O-GlcNAc transferase